MQAPQPPSESGAQLQWLVDRAAIGDLLLDFAHSLDTRQWDSYVENFTEDAVLSIPGIGELQGRGRIAEVATHGLDTFDATLHLSTNHMIAIDGDQATSRSYLQVAHVPRTAEPGRHGDAGGWYDCAYRRTDQGWRFTRVALEVAWTTGSDLPGRPSPA